jgi:hypothetical protein
MLLAIPISGSHNGIRLSKGGIHLILCLALLRVFQNCPASLVLYISGLGWSSVGSFCYKLEYWSWSKLLVLSC